MNSSHKRLVVLALIAIICAYCNADLPLSEQVLNIPLSQQLLDTKAQLCNKADIYQNIEYANIDGEPLLIDLYLPKNAAKPLPIIVWVHGGGWASGSKDACLSTRFIEHGYAAASISYRLSGIAPLPAQIHDCKGGIRWLRANAKQCNIDPDRIGVFGESSGGHLVALLGTSGGVEELEGNVGGNLGYSSDVQAVCDFFGPANMIKMYDFFRGSNAIKMLTALFDGDLPETEALARLASPDEYIDSCDPPFLIMHGQLDKVVPIDQSIQFHKDLKEKGVDVEFICVPDAGHGLIDRPESKKQIIKFFDKHLK